MNEKEKKTNFFEQIKEKFMADKKVVILIVCGILGMLALLLTESPKESNEPQTQQESGTATNFSQYEAGLTTKITALLSSVSGAGNVRVLLTLESYEEYVYAQDEEYFENKSTENSNIEQKKSYIVIDNDKLGGKGGMLVKVITPRVRGVAVVCDGGGSAVVRQQMTAILCSALDIGASKVHIAS
ncbi:MAG: hypothetical protein LBS36_12080 [Oscillospiraceae bacterium]|jgi:stage III sporulation protein AG|nr:hypothetical protein [Oscillospiraceae bacterium]